MNFHGKKSWFNYIKDNKLHSDIPKNPQGSYKGKGWIDWGDWLGTYTIAPKNRKYRPFKEAREYVYSLNISSKNDWYKYYTNNKLPSDIPTNPYRVYKDKGWIDWGDWLGTGTLFSQYTGWSIEKVKELLRSMIESRVIYKWSEARLYKFLLTKGVLNLKSENKHNNFFKNFINAVRTDEGRKIIEDYAFSRSKDIPDLFNISQENNDEEIQEISTEELSKIVNDSFDPLDNTVDRKFYSKISHTVMEILEGYADTFEQASIDEAYLDCTNKISSFSYNTNSLSTVEEYALQIKKTIKEKCGGLLTSIGVAPTKSVAKIASDYQKPDGLTIVLVDELKDFLNTLEVERISGIGIKTQKILKEKLNIKTIGDLANTDVQILIEKFGKKIGTWMWQVANGVDNEPVIPRGDHISLSNETTLENFTLDREMIKQSLYELIDELIERIKNNKYQFRTVGIKLVRTDFSIETREKSYSNYQIERKSIEIIIEELLKKFILEDSLSSSTSTTKSKKNSSNKILPIRKVGLKVSNLMAIDYNSKKNFQSRQMTLLDYV